MNRHDVKKSEFLKNTSAELWFLCLHMKLTKRFYPRVKILEMNRT